LRERILESWRKYADIPESLLRERDSGDSDYIYMARGEGKSERGSGKMSHHRGIPGRSELLGSVRNANQSHAGYLFPAVVSRNK
jgi:hypothetical protein